MDPDSLDTAPDPRGRATAAERRAVVLAGHRNDPETARAGMGHDDPVVRAALPGRMWDVYDAYKRDEWERFIWECSDWDVKTYLDCLP